MVEQLKNISTENVAHHRSILENVRNKIPYLSSAVQQTTLISQIEKARQPTLEKFQDLKKETDKQSKIFIQRSSLYTTVCLLHSWCNNGIATQEDDNKLKLIVKNLSTHNNSGFFSIRKAMKKYFPQLPSIRMFFLYFLFIGWLPNLYIQRSLNKILDYSRVRLKKGDNLPLLGNKLLATLNTYLSDYNRTVQRFRDDKTNLIGDRDAFIKKELHKQELLGYPSIDHLHKNFARAASREDTRPSFRALSNPIKKFQLLNYKLLKQYANFPRTLLLPFAFTIGIIPYLVARITEFIPNRVIKTAHSSIIKYFMPTVIKNTLEAVSQPEFSHAINSFLCDVIQDLLNEMNKRPEEKSIDETPNIVNEALNQEIKKFSELVYTLLKNEPYKTQEELQYIKKHGPDPKSNLERLLKLLTTKGYVDRAWITPIFIEALHLNIVDGFNLLFAKPERLEEYLCNLIVLLNKVFDYVPDPNTTEGRALKEEMKEKQKRREKLVDEVIEKGINLATEDKLNESLYMLSRHQKENLLVSYRKIQKKASDRLPNLSQDAVDILNSSNYVHLTSVQAKHAKEDIEKAMRDIERLFISVSNVLSNENGPVKSQMTRHLRSFLQDEQTLKDSIIKINHLHDRKEGLKLIKTELEKLKHTLESPFQTSSNQIAAIENHLIKLNQINKDHQFDLIIAEYKKLEDQLKKIQAHSVFATKLQEILNTTFFSNNLIFILAKAQKEYLLHLSSKSKEQALVRARNKMLAFLKHLESFSFPQDVHEIKLAMKKILEAQNPSQLNEDYKNALSLVRKKIAKHKSLNQDEQDVLPNYFDKCKVTIEKHLAAFPMMTQETLTELIKQAELLTMTVEKMQKSLDGIGKQGFTDNIDMVTIVKILGSMASFGVGYLGVISKSLSIGLGTTALGSTIFTPIGGIKKLASSAAVPLAKSTADSAYGIITNQSFYEGLIHAYMKQFIDYVKKTKGHL